MSGKGGLPDGPGPRAYAARINLRRWLTPGIGIKRWLLLVFAGELGVALAGAFVFRQLGTAADTGDPLQTVIYVVTLQFIPGPIRALIFAIAGTGVVRLWLLQGHRRTHGAVPDGGA